jgi:hypothetical protein
MDWSNGATQSLSKTQKYTPTGSNTSAHSREPVNQPPNPKSGTSSIAPAAAEISKVGQSISTPQSGSPQNDELWILFGVQAGRKTLELVKICGKQYRNNGFIEQLRKIHKKKRGFWRSLLSFWRFNHCDFVKVSLILVFTDWFSAKHVLVSENWSQSNHLPMPRDSDRY